MPIKPVIEWEQTSTDVIVNVVIKGFKKEAVDVFISDLWVKVNAHPTYLLHLDLLYPIDVQSSSFYFEMPNLRITLKKVLPLPSRNSGIVVLDDGNDNDENQKRNLWETLIIDMKGTPREDVIRRRQASLSRAESLYNMKLNTRENIKAAEQKRYFHEQWELEKEQRREIEHKMAAERKDEQTKLESWRKGELPLQQEEETKKRAKNIGNPGDIFLAAKEAAEAEERERSGGMPGIRQNPGEVRVTFTSKFASGGGADGMPVRSRGDEEIYRKSRYKPVSIEDSPMFWKQRGDQAYAARRWVDAADAYSESIKRDGVFLTCTSNRAACFLRMHDYKRCVADCDLAITMLGNTPASDTTQEKYRRTLIKLHARRGAAKAWQGDLTGALNDYKLSVAYRGSVHVPGSGEAEEFEALERDCAAIEAYMAAHAIKEEHNPLDEVRAAAQRCYYNGKYAEAVENYKKLLLADEYDIKARNNLCATLLHMGNLKEALEQCRVVVGHCHEVAEALNEPGAQSTHAVDSDDEEGEAANDDTGAKRRNAAARLIRENSGHVYLLLKAYVRAAAASCGLKDWRNAIEYFEAAIKITPYDNDLRDDLARCVEKARMTTLVQSSAMANRPAPATPSASK